MTKDLHKSRAAHWTSLKDPSSWTVIWHKVFESEKEHFKCLTKQEFLLFSSNCTQTTVCFSLVGFSGRSHSIAIYFIPSLILPACFLNLACVASWHTVVNCLILFLPFCWMFLSTTDSSLNQKDFFYLFFLTQTVKHCMSPAVVMIPEFYTQSWKNKKES